MVEGVKRPEARHVRGSRVPQEEDEEDRQERERLAATMKLLGIDTQGDPSSDSIPSAADPIERKARPQDQPRQARPPTPLMRFSSFLGRNGLAASSPLSPEAEKLDQSLPLTEDAVKAALSSFDQREREQASHYSRRTVPSGLTSPSPDLIRGIAPRRQASFRAKAGSASPEGSGKSDSARREEHTSSGSIDTLWSLGESPEKGYL